MYITETTENVRKLIEKLDLFSEIIIRYDNETYFEKKITIISFDSKANGFDLAHLLQEQKVK